MLAAQLFGPKRLGSCWMGWDEMWLRPSCPLRMNCSVVGDHLPLHLAPSSGQHFFSPPAQSWNHLLSGLATFFFANASRSATDLSSRR